MTDEGARAAPEKVRVALGARAYDIFVGPQLIARAADYLGDVLKRPRVAIITDETVAKLHLPALEASLDAAGIRHSHLALAPGEQTKCFAELERVSSFLLDQGIERSDMVIALGGGVIGDLTGFAASILRRGVDFVQIPTTLLSQVDSSVGGKTGINTPEGKNLVGAFHTPAGVVCDLDVLATLPPADLVAGLAEVVKSGFIADPRILELVETTEPASLTADSPVLRELVERSVQVKIDVVVGDLKETAGTAGEGHPGREALNYGHTMGHAIERAERYGVRHGEAVAIGSVFVAELARQAGVLDDATADRHASAFGRVGLPTGYAGAGYEELRAAMAVDKKSRGDQLRFVVLHDVGDPRVLAGPSEEHLRAAYDAMVARA